MPGSKGHMVGFFARKPFPVALETDCFWFFLWLVAYLFFSTGGHRFSTRGVVQISLKVSQAGVVEDKSLKGRCFLL